MKKNYNKPACKVRKMAQEVAILAGSGQSLTTIYRGGFTSTGVHIAE